MTHRSNRIVAAALAGGILAAGVVSGCVDQIGFGTERLGRYLVVDGQITDGTGPHLLYLGRTFEGSTVPGPVSGATVTIYDGDGRMEAYQEVGPGIYQLGGEVIKGERGQRYHVEIRLPDGSLYRSAPEKLPEQVGAPDASFSVGTMEEPAYGHRVIERPAVLVYSTTTIPDAANPIYLRWHVKQVYSMRGSEPTSPLAPAPTTCFIEERADPQNIMLFSSRNHESTLVDRQLVATVQVVPYKFYRRHYFNVIVSSITDGAYEYWSRVDAVVNQAGTIFDVPPANVPGNIVNAADEREPVLGYFGAATVDTSRVFTSRGDFSFHISDPCALSNPNRHSACRNCLELENSTTERPHYYGE